MADDAPAPCRGRKDELEVTSVWLTRKRYRAAAQRLATMRTLAAGSDKAAEVDDLVAHLRETNLRRPACSRSSTVPACPDVFLNSPAVIEVYSARCSLQGVDHPVWQRFSVAIDRFVTMCP
jgi:hypothetical protein